MQRLLDGQARPGKALRRDGGAGALWGRAAPVGANNTTREAPFRLGHGRQRCVGAVANDACDGKVLGLVPPQQRTRGAQEVEAEPLLVVLGLGVLRAKLVMDTPMAVSDENGMHMHTIELMAFDPLRSSL